MTAKTRRGSAASRRRGAKAAPARQRLQPDERAEQILQGAIRFFAVHGFAGQTRELAEQLGVSAGLLYRYFPSKEALIERIYREVFVQRLKPEWDDLLSDRGRPLLPRLLAFYREYAAMLHDYDWVRIYLHAGLAGASINKRFGNLVIARIFTRVIGELRHEFGCPDLRRVPMTEPESELMWSLHGAIFYIGVRKWVYDAPVPRDVDGAVVQMVEGLYGSARDLMRHGLPRAG